MNAHGVSKPSVLLSDRQIVAEIEDFLPQSMMRSFRERILQDHVYDWAHATTFSLLDDRLEDIGFMPTDLHLARAFQTFKKNFAKFDGILISQFGFNPNLRRFELHEARKEKPSYPQLLSKIKAAFTLFEESYKQLLITGRAHAKDGGEVAETLPIISSGNIESVPIPTIAYDRKTGLGKIGVKRFKFKKGKALTHLFERLYDNIDDSVSRYDVLVTIGFYREDEAVDPVRRTSETEEINIYAKTLRAKLGLDVYQLVQNNGSLTLCAQK